MMAKTHIADIISYVLTRPDDIIIEHIVIKRN
jgi:NADP-dependent 3-hydroxy acid dehydrogenase YdfG